MLLFPQLSAISDCNDLIPSAAGGVVVPSMATSPPSAPDSRPHTISSAYEKGGAHQRPQLTPYTFEQPTIPENGTNLLRFVLYTHYDA